MPKAHKRKPPVTNTLPYLPSAPSSKSSRSIIRRFHVLLKQQAHLKETSNTDDKQALAQIQDELSRLGGLEVYQRMSAAGQDNERGGGSEKVLIAWFNDLGLTGKHASGTKMRLLEVGALKPDNYLTCSAWLEWVPIDLHPCHPSIREQDFLLLDERENHGKWDIISLSLVLNFLSNPMDRGKMLKLAYSFLNSRGYLFLVLPLPCVLNSRYLDIDHMQRITGTVGFTLIKEKWKKQGKMIYWLFQKGTRPPRCDEALHKRVVLRQGRNRNNFSIVV